MALSAEQKLSRRPYGDFSSSTTCKKEREAYSMKEVICNFEEFKAKVDLNKPLHHSAAIIAKEGFIQRLIFRVYGIDKDRSNILIFEYQKPSPLADVDQLQSDYRRLVEKYAKQLGSTEGAWTT
jgi:hypothetical protein